MILVDGLTKRFGATRVLDGLSIEAPSGQRIALVGSNGAGKTSLFRCLLGEYACQGSISVDGLDPRRDRARLLRTIGFVPQIAPRLETPVGAFIRYVAEVSGASVDEIEAVATSLGLDVAAVRKRAFVRLSGGMKQKLMIALALGRPTRLLILDEPTANLDPAARAGLYDLLAARGRHTAMIISSHRIDEIAPLVDRVVELDRGRIVLDDTVSDAGALGSTFFAQIETGRPEESFARAAREWGLAQVEERRWRGTIAGPDRLRFLGFVARHAGRLAGVELREAHRENGNADTHSA
ncbi:ABC transporter ATP-binding protein [Bradyrhizobium sp.]|uniref:ABC transporter ATP-binding protein n=1 Tax=Bradyrhizobium sp. TaxID=376 RepID=UPI00238E4269|nr:ABC transporter ATP-binding protein [Bradyrhizobium sp.]MDE2375767.1 ABC transporter ATP-binding protein [Bradyrhizobium sp.]